MSTSNNDIRAISDAIGTLKEQAKSLEDILKTTVQESYHINPAIIDDILPYTLVDIESFDEPKCREILGKYSDHNALSTTIKDLIETNDAVTNENEAVHYILRDIKESSLKLLSTKLEVKKIESEADKFYDEIISKYNAPESVEDRKNNLLKMQEEIDAETDPERKAELQKKFAVLSKAFSLDFFTERLENLGEKEVKSIIETFFNNTKSAYVINRYKNTVRMMKTVSPEIYRNFFNIEQYFCGEEYYKFNNLFLFIYMRFIGYSSPYNKSDKIYAQAITSAITNLMYHRFGSSEYEADMINLVKKVDDYFQDYADMFEEMNLMNPNHPENAARTKEFDEKRKEKIKVALDKFNIPVENYEEKTPEELQKILNDAIDAMVEAQVDDYNKTQNPETEEHDEDESIPELSSEEDFNEVLNSVEDTPVEETTPIDEIENPPVIDPSGLKFVNTDTGEEMNISLPGVSFAVVEEEKN